MKNKILILLAVVFFFIIYYSINKQVKTKVATNRIHHYMEVKGFPIDLIKKEDIHYSYSTDRWNLSVIMKDDENYQYNFEYRFRTNDIQEGIEFLTDDYMNNPAKYNKNMYEEKIDKSIK